MDDDDRPAMRTTRLAPSPTGSLHLGNLRTFISTWLVARSAGWTLRMRIEDLDAGRVRPGATEGILETLRWLGVDFDGPPLVQSDDLEPYRAAMRTLARGGSVYPCELSRSQIRAALSAPHADGAETPFPAALRPPKAEWGFAGGERGHRFAVPDLAASFVDVLAGPQQGRPAQDVGDFIVWTRDGVPSYQLAVVVDDARQAVTDVIRGDDLLPSAGRQSLLHHALGTSVPRWWHLPLVVDGEGRRLAKRDGAHQIDALRRDGATAERVLGLIGEWLGILPRRELLSSTDLLARFVELHQSVPTATPVADTLSSDAVAVTAAATFPAHPVALRSEDLAWLIASTVTVTPSDTPPQ